MIDFLIGLLVVLLIAALVYGLATLIIGLFPVDARIKQIALAIVAAILVLWILTHLLAVPGVRLP